MLISGGFSRKLVLVGPLLDDHITSVELRPVLALFEEAARTLHDPCFGLHLANAARPGSTGLVARLVLNSPTVRDGLRVLVQYSALHMTKTEIGFREEDGVAYLNWLLPTEITQPSLQYSSFMSAIVMRRLAEVIGGDWKPRKCELAHRALECADTVREVFGSRVEFDRPMNLFVFNSAALDTLMPGADPMTFAVYEDLARRWAEEMDGACPPDVVVATRAQILEFLSGGRADLTSVAHGIGIGTRVLQRRLENVGTSFEKILNETRTELAEQLLRDTDRSVTDIAFELGYSDSSAFTRAAKRWFSMSPRQYRQSHRAPSRLGPSHK